MPASAHRAAAARASSAAALERRRARQRRARRRAGTAGDSRNAKSVPSKSTPTSPAASAPASSTGRNGRTPTAAAMPDALQEVEDEVHGDGRRATVPGRMTIDETPRGAGPAAKPRACPLRAPARTTSSATRACSPRRTQVMKSSAMRDLMAVTERARGDLAGRRAAGHVTFPAELRRADGARRRRGDARARSSTARPRASTRSRTRSPR